MGPRLRENATLAKRELCFGILATMGLPFKPTQNVCVHLYLSLTILQQAYALRTTADPVMRRSVTETCLVIHPIQFWSVGISFVDDGLVLKILA